MNQYLQYRAIGPWRDYLVAERGYIWLSLGAKSLLGLLSDLARALVVGAVRLRSR